MTSLEVLVVPGSLFSYQELPVIPLVITLSSVIKSLVRKSIGGALNLGRDEGMEGVDGDGGRNTDGSR